MASSHDELREADGNIHSEPADTMSQVTGVSFSSMVIHEDYLQHGMKGKRECLTSGYTQNVEFITGVMLFALFVSYNVGLNTS